MGIKAHIRNEDLEVVAGVSVGGSMDKFLLTFKDGGFVEVSWRGIILAEGRPWISDPNSEGYSKLLLAVWNDKNTFEEKVSDNLKLE